MLNNWEWPNVPGLHSFKGPYMHSADYNDSFDSTGKRVAVVGGGSSGIQILPHIQKTATHVDHYMRSHNWIAPVGFGAIELEKRGKLDEGNCESHSLFVSRSKLINGFSPIHRRRKRNV
jgi:cation diffusion facilitator CzcD-associated flavoprotein CzcO